MTFIGTNIESYFNEFERTSLNMFSLKCVGQAGPKVSLAKEWQYVYRQEELKVKVRTKMQKYHIVQHNFSISNEN